MGLTEEELKMVKSAGRTVAAVTDKHISVLYKIDKARNTSALLDALRQVSKYVSGMPENLKERYKAKGFFYPPAIEELLELLVKNESKNIFQDIKNVLVIYSSVGLARLAYKGNKGGSSK